MKRIGLFTLLALAWSPLMAQMKYFVSTNTLAYYYGDSIHVTVGATNIGKVPDTLWLSDCDVAYSIDSFSMFGHFGHGPCPLTQAPNVVSPGDSLEWTYVPPFPVTKDSLADGRHSVVGEVGGGFSDTLWVTVNTLNAVREEPAAPQGYALENNYPDPFNPSTTIRYTLPVSGRVAVHVYNILGQAVGTLVEGNQNVGTYEVSFNASALSSGVYFYRIESGSFSAVKKMMLLK